MVSMLLEKEKELVVYVKFALVISDRLNSLIFSFYYVYILSYLLIFYVWMYVTPGLK